MRPIIILILLMTFSSCSSLTRSKIYAGLGGALIGGAIGTLAGKSLSPDFESESFNKTLGMGIGSALGATSGALMAHYFWNDNPEHWPLKPMFPEDPKYKGQLKINESSKIEYLPLKNPKSIPLTNTIPAFLKGKLKKGRVITFEVPEFLEESTSGETIYHEAHKAYKYVIE